jgi:autotransporter-associated beta strand protein
LKLKAKAAQMKTSAPFRKFRVVKFLALWSPTMLLFIFSTMADDGYWIAGNGSWTNPNNWDSGIIADGTDNTAYFGLFADIPANLTVTLDGARTIGNLYFTDPSGADSVILNTGGGGPLTLDATFGPPSVTVALANQQVAINVTLAGDAGLEKLGVGSLLLNATNTFTGETLVSAGTLLVNGQLGTDAVTVASGALLGGTGIISGPVTVQSGGTLAPGHSIGTLTISNSLTLQAGSTTRMEVNASILANDTVRGLSSVSYGGTLVVSNLSGTPATGQSFALFSARGAGGNFSSLTPQLTGSVRWRFDPASGVLSVVATNSQPRFAAFNRAGTNLVMQVANGAPGVTNYVLTSTNLARPRTNWTRLATNVFDLSGNFTFTNAVSPATPQRFFLISVGAGT